MKTLAVTLTLLSWSTAVFAQGKVQFGNDSLHLIYFSPFGLLPADTVLAGQGTTSTPTPSGITFVADLFAGTSSASLTLQATTTFQPVPGRLTSMNVVLSSIPGGTTAFFQVEVRDINDPPGGPLAGNNGPYFNETQVFTAVPGASIAYNSLWSHGSPGNSTWPDGTFDMSAQTGLAGARGAIELGVIPEPSVLGLCALAGAAVLLRGKPAVRN